MNRSDTELRFSWFVGFAVLAHIAVFWWLSSSPLKPKETVPIEQHVLVNLSSAAPSLAPASISNPAPAETVPVPHPDNLPKVAPLRKAVVPRRTEPMESRPVRLVKKSTPNMSSPLLEAPAVEAPVREEKVGASAPVRQATVAAPASGKPAATTGKPTSAPQFGDYLSSIRAMIEEQKRYPLISRRMRQEGSVEVRFKLGNDGRIKGHPAVVGPSRYPALDRAAIESVSAAAPFPPIPKELGVETLDLNLVIVFNLRE